MVPVPCVQCGGQCSIGQVHERVRSESAAATPKSARRANDQQHAQACVGCSECKDGQYQGQRQGQSNIKAKRAGPFMAISKSVMSQCNTGTCYSRRGADARKTPTGFLPRFSCSAVSYLAEGSAFCIAVARARRVLAVMLLCCIACSGRNRNLATSSSAFV